MQLRATHRRLAVTFLASALVAASSTAWAEPNLSDRETARSLMDDGDAKRDKGALEAALKSYEAADAIMHVPTTGLEVARVQAKLGRLLEARQTLVRVLRLPAKAGEPAPFTAARKAADALSTDLGGRIPSVTVLVSNAEPGQTPTVTFDGHVIPPAAARAPRKVNPGHHVVVVRAGSVEKKNEVDVAEGEAKTLSVDLTPAPAAVPLDESTASSRAPSPLPKVLIYGGFGIGAVGVGVGAVTGLMSLSKVSDVKKDCVNDICPAGRQPDIDSAKSLGTVSTIAFIAGGAGVAAGVIGLVLQSKQASTEPTPGASVKLRVRPELGPTWAGLRGTF